MWRRRAAVPAGGAAVIWEGRVLRILNRIAFRFGLILAVLTIISIFAKDSHKVQEVSLFGTGAAIAWLIYFVTRGR